jgi:hypothetical protein
VNPLPNPPKVLYQALREREDGDTLILAIIGSNKTISLDSAWSELNNKAWSWGFTKEVYE